MRAFHNDSRVRDFFLARVRAHKAAGQITKGAYWRDGLGCAVGCTIHSSSHLSYPGILGIPVILAHLEDRIFEGLPLPAAQDWPEKFLSVIPVGADLSQIWAEFVVWRLVDAKDGVIKYALSEGERQVIWQIAQLHKERCRDNSAFRAALMATHEPMGAKEMPAIRAQDAATLAAEQAVFAADAAASADAVAASVVVVAAADAAASAAIVAGETPSAAKEAAYVSMADKVLELLAAAPVKK